LAKNGRSKDPQILARHERVVQLRLLGFKIPQIVEKLAEEGRRWSYHTIKLDTHSITAEEVRDELKRQQFADIALAESRRDRLEYRDRMIERMDPRKSPEFTVRNESNVQVNVKQDANVNAVVQGLLKRHREFVEERDREFATSSNNCGESVDPPEAHGEAGTVPQT
jgi:hypothetical protein